MIEYLQEIEAHIEAEYPREACGVLAVVKGKLKWFPCENIAEGTEHFIMSSSEYLEIYKRADIVGIVHSHPDSSPKPSQCDIDHCNVLGVPYYIFSYPGMDMSLTEPTNTKKALMGREYEFGVQDCFEAIRDYYTQELGIDIPKRIVFEDNWWERGLDYFSEEYIAAWGFKKVEKAEVGSLLTFAVGSSISNHCGIYLGNDIFYHHATQRLSCRESLQSIWGKNLTGIYKYVT